MINLIDKISFLIKSKSSYQIIQSFILTKIKNLFIKNKIKKLKRQNVKYLEKKKITNDYFSSHSYNFYSIIKSFKIKNILEIGSFEGNSSMFFARNLTNAKIFCVDNWIGTEEYNNINFESIESHFDQNVKEFKNIIKLKYTSDEFFKKNNIHFDLIYIDGYHKAHQVTKDFKNAWSTLSKNGVLIFDDYIWNFYDNIEDNPCYAINRLLKQITSKFKILKVSNSQLFIKKL